MLRLSNPPNNPTHGPDEFRAYLNVGGEGEARGVGGRQRAPIPTRIGPVKKYSTAKAGMVAVMRIMQRTISSPSSR